MENRRRPTVLALVVLSAVFISGGCSGGGAQQTGTPSTVVSSEEGLTLVALGDSWPQGDHCGGCRTFAGRYADGLEAVTGLPIRFVDLTQAVVPTTGLGQTANTLLADVQGDEGVRRAVVDADIILIATGLNELDQGSLDSYLAGNCGGDDGARCFETLGPEWEASFDAILREIETLRAGRPAAVRLVTSDNPFISDPGLIETFGPRFGRTIGSTILQEFSSAICSAASSHGATCVDVLPILNGPAFDRPVDSNSDASHQKVADALVATGLAELGR